MSEEVDVAIGADDGVLCFFLDSRSGTHLADATLPNAIDLVGSGPCFTRATCVAVSQEASFNVTLALSYSTVPLAFQAGCQAPAAGALSFVPGADASSARLWCRDPNRCRFQVRRGGREDLMGELDDGETADFSVVMCDMLRVEGTAALDLESYAPRSSEPAGIRLRRAPRVTWDEAAKDGVVARSTAVHLPPSREVVQFDDACRARRTFAASEEVRYRWLDPRLLRPIARALRRWRRPARVGGEQVFEEMVRPPPREPPRGGSCGDGCCLLSGPEDTAT